MTDKVIRDGKVAVLYSPGYGAGWSTWADSSAAKKWALFSPKVVGWVERGKPDGEIEDIVKEAFGENHFYVGGARDLEILWIEQGTQFLINEYDGYESVDTNSDTRWTIA